MKQTHNKKANYTPSIIATETKSSLQKEQLIQQLYDIGAIQFGSFVLKSGATSPIYIDLRRIISHPTLLHTISNCLWDKIKRCRFDALCGVPYTGIPIATSIALLHNQAMIMLRKETKNHGNKQRVEGIYKQGDRIIVLDDLVTNGLSKLETIKTLQDTGLMITDIIVLIDRKQGAQQNLAEHGYQLHSAFTLPEMLTVLEKNGAIDTETMRRVEKALTNIPQQKQTTPTALSYADRAQYCTNKTAKTLFTLMEEKQTNLAIAADVTTKKELLTLADAVGPEICLLKLHIDIIQDFDNDLINKLQLLAQKHRFLIFEDRKFADIGNTVRNQYQGGIYHIADWADIINAHIIPGPGIIQGLKEIGKEKNRSLILIAQMTPKGNLAHDSYTAQAVEMAQQHSDFVIGFIAKEKLTDNPQFIHMTPGVKLQEGSDDLGQQYLTPDKVIKEQCSDIIIVGRGIYQAKDPRKNAQTYRKAGWDAYKLRLT